MKRIICDKCGQEHSGCTAHSRTGRPCGNPPMHDTHVCRMHGGTAPWTQAAIARRRAERATLAEVETLGLPLDITPTEALLEEVQWTAGHVQWLRAKLQDLDHDDMTWGKTREKVGGEDYGTTSEATPPVWYELYDRERKHLVTVCAAALKAGVEERRVKLAEQQGALVSEALTRILDTLYATLTDAGITADQQTVWAETVTVVVPRELRRMAAGGDNAA